MTVSGQRGWRRRDEHGEPVELIAAGHPVEISSPQKPMFPEPGITKLDLARYYLAVEEPIMRTVRDRPTLLQRFPNGVTGSNFFQKRIPDSAPDWLQTTIVSTPNGTTSRAIVMADIAHVLWAANLGCLGFHPWPYRADDPDNTDELRIDLDPSPGVTFPMVQEAAAEVRRFLDDNGDHLVHQDDRQPRPARLRPRRAGLGLVRHPASGRRGRPGTRRGATRPDHRQVVEGGARRQGVHRLQPERPAQDGVRRVVRARPPGAQVSTPFSWEELPAIHPDDLTVRSVPGRLAASGDPWADIDDRGAVDRPARRALRARPRQRHP